MKTLAEQLKEERNGNGCGAPIEPIELTKQIKNANLAGYNFLPYYKLLSMQQQLWLKNNGIGCEQVFDRNDMFYHLTW